MRGVMAEETKKDMLCGLPFFRRHSDIRLFKRLGFACVYAFGPQSGRPLKIGWTSQPSGRFTDLSTSHWTDMKIHDVVWTPGPPLAKRLEKEIHRILTKAGKHLKGEWFDVPVDMIVPIFQVATDNLKIPTFTHDAMLERFEEARDMQAHHALRHFGESVRAA
jgi:hypothetical protein